MRWRQFVSILVLILMVGLFFPVSALAKSLPYEEIPYSDLTALAHEFMQRRTSGVIDTKDAPAQITVNGVARESAWVLASEQQTILELNTRRDVLRDWGTEYTHYSIDLTLEAVWHEKSIAILDFREFTKLYYANIKYPPYTAFVSHRRFEFAKVDEVWILTSQELINPHGLLPSNEPTGVSEAEMRAALERTHSIIEDPHLVREQAGISEPSVMPLGSFDRELARSYAYQYWQHGNPAYRDFTPPNGGGDCTNFVSQCMYAGGWTHSSGWWYAWLTQSRSWTAAGSFYNFAFIQSGRTTILSNPLALIGGEVLQMDNYGTGSINHSMIVTATGPNRLFLTYRTPNTLNRCFSDIAAQYSYAIYYPHAVFWTFN